MAGIQAVPRVLNQLIRTEYLTKLAEYNAGGDPMWDFGNSVFRYGCGYTGMQTGIYVYSTS